MLIRFKIKIDSLKTQKHITVYLPEDYKSSNNKYNVVYMHDSQNLFEAHLSNFNSTWEILKRFNNINQEQAIFVGIDHGHEKRIDEYSPFIVDDEAYKMFTDWQSSINPLYKKPKKLGGQGFIYIKWIKEVLVPYINKNYRTNNNNLMIGSSMGGLISLIAGLEYPDTFSKLGVLSPAFWVCNEKIKDYVNNKKKQLKKLKIFMSVGDSESTGKASAKQYISVATEMANIFKENEIDYNFRIIKNGKHNEEWWAKIIEDVYKFLSN